MSLSAREEEIKKEVREGNLKECRECKEHKENKPSPLLEALMNQACEIITIKDRNYRYLDCNRAFLNHLKLKNRKEIINKTIFEILPEENSSLIKKKIDEIIKNKESQSYVFEIIKGGEKKVVKQTSTPIIIDNEIQYILTISTDITKDIKIKEELSTRNNQIKALLEHLPILVYMKDKNKNFLIGSKYAKDFIYDGYDRHQKILRLNMDSVQDLTEEEDDFVLKNKKFLIKEKEVLDYSENKHFYEVLKAPIFKEDGDIDGLITITRNIDIQKQLENQKDMFIATLVHDLKNPLLAQISCLELMYKNVFGKLNEVQEEMLETTLESAKYMKEMLFTMINTYKYDKGAIELQKEKMKFSSLVDTCIKEHKSLAQSRGIEIIYEKEENDEISIDKRQMRRVIANLLNNGINYADENTKFEIKEKINNDVLEISFKNKGTPIDEDTKKHLFEKYISNASKYKKIGFGLGMYLSKKVLEAHNGKIGFKEVDEKNVFSIYLPLEQSTTGRVEFLDA